ncbi:hypothetical protein AKO1_013812 [Acrasis kona]|uniref:Uncharacterized protein n=1 Tax=Acrasis kona TaxID=1008807 RepID=A0AAW2YLR5_9EUKA
MLLILKNFKTKIPTVTSFASMSSTGSFRKSHSYNNRRPHSSQQSNSNNNPNKQISASLKSPYPIIDIGANINKANYKHDLDRVLDRSLEANVTNIIITGTDMKNSGLAVRICQDNKSKVKLYCTVGVHPHYSKDFNDDTINLMRGIIKKHPNIVKSVGECGLDFNRNYSPQDIQIQSFDKQVALAVELNLPLFLHEREAHQDLITVLQKHYVDGKLPVKAVIHCFTGTKDEAKYYIEQGYYIGFTGVICQEQRGRTLREVIKDVVPIERIMIETDCPFMFPDNKYRDEFNGRNEPCLLPAVSKTIATCKGLSEEEVAKTLTANTLKFFNLE